MKKTLSIVLVIMLCASLLTACKTKEPGATSSATPSEKTEEKKAEKPAEEPAKRVIKPLEETIDIENLDNCTVAVSLNEGDAFVDDSGKLVMKVKVYTYDLYDMVDIASVEENDIIMRLGKEITVSQIERLETGLVRINGGEENGGFDLISNDSTVYYEIGMSDIKSYYEIGEVTIPVSTEFTYLDESDIDAGAKEYYPGDFLDENSGINYDFNPNNTSVVIENNTIIKMKKVYTP